MLSNKYNFSQVEEKIKFEWEKIGVFSWNGKCDFIIDTPPPTISGVLHIGHIFSYCHADFIARYNRMTGKDVFYPMGFDDNGLPTERLVEKNYGIKSDDLERSEFIKLCEKVSESGRKEFRDVLSSIGLSIDWTLEYNTIGEKCRALSQMSFIDLFKKNLVYRADRPVFWDTIQQTAIAQAEIEDKESQSFMCYVRFQSESDSGSFVIATTRPEMLSACVAVFVHPEDSRYFSLHNSFAITPIFNDKVPILCDTLVKPDKGTGAVMCCTFGDELDLLWCEKHSLPIRIIISKDGRISQDRDPCNGMKVINARKKMRELLLERGFTEKEEEISHFVKTSERSGANIEILQSKQWFIKLLDHKEELLKQAKSCNWHPSHMFNKIEQWISSISWDWCISRQRYFGVPFPVWYSKSSGEVILPDIKQLPVDPKTDKPLFYDSPEDLEPDVDVMDTWATSSITPQINAGWINDEYNFLDRDYNVNSGLYPSTLRPQAHEIIRSWAFYTIVKSYFHANCTPWSDVMISGWCLARDKTKMSKSKGNVISAYDLIRENGADIVRYWAASARLGTDFVYCDNTFKMGKKLVNKLWNASKFVSMFYTKSYNISSITEPMDLWLLNKIGEIIDEVTNNFKSYEYSVALDVVEGFFWKIFCDNYLELVKSRAYKGDSSASHTLGCVLDALLRLFAPFIPFITEEIFSVMFGSIESIHARGNWPNASIYYSDLGSKVPMHDVIYLLKSVREFKSQRNISIKSRSGKMTVEFSDKNLISMSSDIENACNLDEINWVLLEDATPSIRVKLE